MKHHTIVIIGGGNAGISVAARLANADRSLDIAVVEPSQTHYYQPAWTLVGGGTFDINKTARSMRSVIPKGVQWIQGAVQAFEPLDNKLKLQDGSDLTYDYLVVCPGIQINLSAIEGLEETIGKNGVCTNYLFQHAPYTYECLKNFPNGGTALFTNPGTSVKCGGAPQKIMYLVSDYLKKKGKLRNADIRFMTAGKKIFSIEKYRNALLKVVKRYGIQPMYSHDLVKVDGEKKEASFRYTDHDGEQGIKTIQFDMMHVTPPQGPPDFIKNSPIANEKGWVDVDKFSLQHNQFKNIFSLGDASSLPSAKTGAAVRKQAPVLVQNLLSLMADKKSESTYSGYGSCPLVTGYGKLILAEFDYSGQPTETFPFNQAKERWSMWFLKKYILPWMYWNKILKGKA